MERIKTRLKKVKPNHIVFALAVGGIVFAAVNFGNRPLFNSPDGFVLFAQEEIQLNEGAQVSSGDIGANKEINIDKNVIINGNLFADKIDLNKNVSINGNVSFNKLETEKDTKILGTKTTPVSLPIANLPEIPDFTIGTQDFKFQGQNNTLAAGNYHDLALEQNSRLELSGGTYNLRKLILKENSTLIFNAPTTLNIQFKLKGEKHISILPGSNLQPTDLVINYLGIRPKNEKEEKEDDDDEINNLHDEKEKKENKEGKIGRPIVFGKELFLNFKLLAPKASVKIGEMSTIRGQVLARKIKVEKRAILSRKSEFEKESDPAKIIIDTNGSHFIVNEIIILITSTATLIDIQAISNAVNARVVGFLPILGISKIEVQTINLAELNQIVNKLKALNNPFITDVLPNFIFQ